MANRLDGIHTRITSNLCPWGELGCHIPLRKESSGFFGLWRWEHFSLQPFQRAYCLVGVGILKWFLIITWIIRKDSYYYSLLLLFFSVSSSSFCGSRLFRRSALISEPVHNLSQCLLFSFDWLNHIQLWSLTNQKFLFFWLIHFLYQEIWKRTSVLSCLNRTWFSVFFSFNV